MIGIVELSVLDYHHPVISLARRYNVEPPNLCQILIINDLIEKIPKKKKEDIPHSWLLQ